MRFVVLYVCIGGGCCVYRFSMERVYEIEGLRKSYIHIVVFLIF